jgi:hypothetical protein
MFFLDLISKDSIITIPSVLFLHPSLSSKPTPPSFSTANTNSSSNDPPSMPWIDAARPPHGTAIHW